MAKSQPNAPVTTWHSICMSGDGKIRYASGLLGIYISNDFGTTWILTSKEIITAIYVLQYSKNLFRSRRPLEMDIVTEIKLKVLFTWKKKTVQLPKRS